MIASYHNHTNWSDGRASVAELVAAARTQGVQELGISDHFALHPHGDPLGWSIPAARLTDYVADVRGHAAATGMQIRVGLEVEWFPGQAELLRRTLADLPLDYRICGVHFVDLQPIDMDPGFWQPLTADQRDALYRRYWRLVREMAETGLFQIAAHLDLPKKFGIRPSGNLRDVIFPALDAIRQAGMVVELNTAGWRNLCREPYPAIEILRACRERDIPVTVSADAHLPEQLLHEFARAVVCLQEAGYAELARFGHDTIRYEPLAAAIPPAPAANAQP